MCVYITVLYVHDTTVDTYFATVSWHIISREQHCCSKSECDSKPQDFVLCWQNKVTESSFIFHTFSVWWNTIAIFELIILFMNLWLCVLCADVVTEQILVFLSGSCQVDILLVTFRLTFYRVILVTFTLTLYWSFLGWQNNSPF